MLSHSSYLVTVPHTPKESENKIPGQTPRGRLDLGQDNPQILDPRRPAFNDDDDDDGGDDDDQPSRWCSCYGGSVVRWCRPLPTLKSIDSTLLLIFHNFCGGQRLAALCVHYGALKPQLHGHVKLIYLCGKKGRLPSRTGIAGIIPIPKQRWVHTENFIRIKITNLSILSHL